MKLGAQSLAVAFQEFCTGDGKKKRPQEEEHYAVALSLIEEEEI